MHLEFDMLLSNNIIAMKHTLDHWVKANDPKKISYTITKDYVLKLYLERDSDYSMFLLEWDHSYGPNPRVVQE